MKPFRSIATAATVVGLLAGGLAGCGHQSSPSTNQTSKSTNVSAPSNQNSNSGLISSPPSQLDPLTGLKTPQHGPLVAVMVENTEYGRPQYGLHSADIVYEAYTEFFYYSRFMLMFWGQAPSQVGPVRSARPYFVSLVHEWPAAYAHAGASDPGYTSIAQDHIHNLDLDANAYNLGYRVSSRPAPHNLFVNMSSVMQAADTNWGNPRVTGHWPFVSHVSSGTPPYQTITLEWNPRNTLEQWRWDPAANGWTRWVEDQEANTGFQQVMGLNSGQPVVASNVVIEYTTENYLYDPAGTGWISVNTRGQGKALLFLGHRFYDGIWKNNGSGTPTHFYLSNGKEAAFDPGQTWIEIVPNSQSAQNPFHLTLGQ